MGDQTLVVIAATFENGRDGFYLLNDHVDAAKADTASGEELLDHSCALLAPTAKYPSLGFRSRSCESGEPGTDDLVRCLEGIIGQMSIPFRRDALHMPQ